MEQPQCQRNSADQIDQMGDRATELMLMFTLAWYVWIYALPKRFGLSFETGCVNVTEEGWHAFVSFMVINHRLPERLPAIHTTSSSREIPSHEYRDDRTRRCTAHLPVSLCLICSHSKSFLPCRGLLRRKRYEIFACLCCSFVRRKQSTSK